MKFHVEKLEKKECKIDRFWKVPNFTTQICRARPTFPPYGLIQNIQKHDLQFQNSQNTENVQLFQQPQPEFQQINTHLPKFPESNVQQPSLPQNLQSIEQPVEQPVVQQGRITERESTVLALREAQ